MTISAQANQNVQVAQTPKTQAPAPAAMKALQAQQNLATESPAAKESVTLSPAAQASLAEHKAETAFAAGTKAFGNLKDSDRSELAGMIQARFTQNGDQKLSENQSNDIKAQVALQWLDQREHAGTLPAGYEALDSAAHDYQAARQEVKALNGETAPAARPASDINAFFPIGSELAKDSKSVASFKIALGAYDKLSDSDRENLNAEINAAFDRRGGLDKIDLEEANGIRAQVASDWSLDPSSNRKKDENIARLGAFAYQYGLNRYNYFNPDLGN